MVPILRTPIEVDSIINAAWSPVFEPPGNKGPLDRICEYFDHAGQGVHRGEELPLFG